jgi:hypothetical protein
VWWLHLGAMNMIKKVKYAGIVEIISDDTRKLRFHASKAKNKTILWINVPGRALSNFIKLPQTLSKLNAARYLLQHKNFKKPIYQKFLKDEIKRIEHRSNGKMLSPRSRQKTSHQSPQPQPQQQSIEVA